MEAKLYNQDGDQIGVIQVSDYIFGIDPNVAVMHQASVRQFANARAGTHSTRGRGEVAGSTRKLYRQKGTGRARQGSIRAPHRRGGGIAHGPHPRSYEKHMPRKMRRLAVRSALSVKLSGIRFVDVLEFDVPRTRAMIEMLEDQDFAGKTLIVLDRKEGYENLYRSANNLPNVKILLAHYLNVNDLLNYDNVLMTVEAVRVAESYLGDGTLVTGVTMLDEAALAAAEAQTTNRTAPVDEDADEDETPLMIRLWTTTRKGDERLSDNHSSVDHREEYQPDDAE
ncbi:MAG: 50S ribosomal protein L4 [Chloroflexaceae bacterium]|nr:50S ribosomal protein L4 [Chloroflexaceae bacterium]NJO04764.1 50S ribosomal protein L4 [Chloroflexaceae bacterium]